jgi:hypothetical protein
MKREHGLAAFVVGVVLLAGSVLLAEEAVTSAPADGGLPVSDQIAKYVKIITAATTAQEAQHAYLLAGQLDKNNSAVLNAYMRKMLSLGLPDAALSASIVLNTVELDNALAWAVTGYVNAKRGDYARGLVADAHAQQAAPGDSAVEHNLGQLIAWFDHFSKTTNIASADQALVNKVKADLKSDAYSKAYQSINDSYKAIDSKKQDMAQHVKAAESALKDAQKKVDDIDKKGKAANQQIAALNGTITNLRNQRIDAGANYNTAVRNRDQQIQREQQQVNTLTKQIQDLNAQFAAAVKDRNDKQKALEDAHSGAGPEMAAVLRKMTWELNMDGKPVPLAAGASVAPTGDAAGTATSAPAGDVAPSIDPAAAEARAGELLKTAKAYLDNGLKDKAGEMLKDIVKIYSTTSAAQEAQKLLDSAGLQ